MKFILRPRALALALALAFAASLPFLSTAILGQNAFFFEATISANVPAGVQLFYDVGRGFNESDSVYLSLYNHSTPRLYRFVLPAGHYGALRLDPIDVPGAATVADARIVDGYGGVVRRFPPEQFRPANQIGRSVTKSGVLEMTTIPGGNDPFYVIDYGAPLELKTGPGYWFKAAAPAFTIVFLLALFFAAVPLAPLQKCWRWCGTHPGRAIAAGSALTVALACHPVIFFGKSFVSPDNGVLLLHDQYPTMDPTGPNDIEWPQYSDIGAMMWWHFYCPVIAHDALFRDHELPLWNRYSLGGLPFLGQGQTMFGDPLNFLPILTRSSAWSWDLKFVLSRWLFCCGLGLAVFALTSELAAALAVAFGACFISFFIFRLNHAANFSVCYSPWILVAWIRLTEVEGRRRLARGCLLLLLANFAVMNSGTMKEAYMLMVCVNLGGLLLLLFDSGPRHLRRAKAAWAVAAGLTFFLATAPWWRTFIAALKQSHTAYDVPAVSQLSPTRLLGFFDDLFSSQLQPAERSFMPSVNFLLLLGVLWAAAAWRDLAKRRGFVSLALAALLPLALVYGGVPASLVSRVPFVANINSVDNTFSCSLIVFAAVLAGFGFSAMARSLRQPGWTAEFIVVAGLFGALGLVFFGANPEVAPSPFFVGYALCLAIAFFTLAVGLRWAQKSRDGGLAVAVLVIGAFLLVWRNGEYLRTPFDRYVFNPKARIDLRTPSPAIDFIDRQMKEPSRPLGFGLNLFAGYNEMFRWESILGVDPLRSRRYDELAAALGLGRVANAAQPNPPQQEAVVGPGLDLLNVRYYLASPESRPFPIARLKFLRELDFGVYESASAWPRAFFTDRLWRYDTVAQFAAEVKEGDGRPFAAVQTQDESAAGSLRQMRPDLKGRTITAATHYRLTTNTTSFRIEAPSAGVVVLTENYYRDDFHVTVNGRAGQYFRINHAFKGVYLDRPGSYQIEFEYRPRGFALSLQLAGLGLLGVAAFCFLALRRDPPAGSAPLVAKASA